MITVKRAIELVAEKVNLSPEFDRDKILSVITGIDQKAWKEGAWRGMVRSFQVNRLSDNSISSPAGYSNLIAVNMNSRPRRINGLYFEFMHNEQGDISKCCGKNWSDAFVYAGESPVSFQPRDANYCCELDCSAATIFVAPSCVEDDGVNLNIQGFHADNKPIYTYKKSNKIVIDDGVIKTAKDDLIFGVNYPLYTGNGIKYKNIGYTFIDKITKPITRGFVDIFYHFEGNADDDGDEFVHHVARLQPNDTFSSIIKYTLPQKCSDSECIHGLFKVSKPKPYRNDEEVILIRDEEALSLLAIGWDFQFNKRNPVAADTFFNKGIGELNKDTNESVPNDGQPVDFDVLPITTVDL